jgi:adenine-specific DNA-methyltransferase
MADGNISELPTGLYWKGRKTEVERIALPFQTIEIINESRATREKEKGTFLKTAPDISWYNRLVWGDNKYIMASLMDEFAGKIDLIYIDPPFATGADFSVKMEIGDVAWEKEPSAIEDKAYRDTWGKGLESYLQMMYERLVLMRELLAADGSIYIHLDWRMSSYVRIIADEIFGQESYTREIIWRMGWVSGYKTMANNWIRNHDNILFYSKDPENFTFNKKWIPYPPGYERWGGRPKGQGLAIEDMWGIFPGEGVNSLSVISFAKENLGFPTQKSEGLLERIIEVSSNEGDLVADFFCGSGTSGTVAEKLGRRWIMADLSRYAIHVTRKRLLGIDQCKPFVVQNLGKYERQYWQGITFKKRSNEQIPIYEYIEFTLDLYHAEPISGMMHIHGKKGRRLVHVGAVDAPVTLSEIKEAISEVKKSGQDSLDILGWEWEMGLHDVVEKEAKTEGVHLRLFNIPRDVMDPRAVEKGDVTFYELAYLEVEVSYDKHNEQFLAELKDFAIPNLDLVPPEIRDKIKKWSDYIDYWAVDWDWNQDIFHNMWQSYRTRKDRTLQLRSDGHIYETKGDHLLMVKVIDVFGNDTTRVVEVKS